MLSVIYVRKTELEVRRSVLGEIIIICGRPILQLWFLISYSSSSLILVYSQRSHIGSLPYFHTWCGLSGNLECRFEMCCTRIAENTGLKNSPKIRYPRSIAQICRAISSQLWHVLTVTKLVKQQYILQMSSQFGKLRPTSGWDRLASLGHPIKFQRVTRLGFVTAPTSLNGGQPNFALYLAVSWAGTLRIHFRPYFESPNFMNFIV